MWYVGLDVHLDTTAISIRDSRGAIVRRCVVPPTRAAMKAALRRVRGRMRVICETGPIAAGVRDALESRVRDEIVCDRRRTRLSSSGAKTDRIDADMLSDLARSHQIHVLHIPRGEAAMLRRYALHYNRMLRERSRVIQRLRSLFFECAVRVKSPPWGTGTGAARAADLTWCEGCGASLPTTAWRRDGSCHRG